MGINDKNFLKKVAEKFCSVKTYTYLCNIKDMQPKVIILAWILL